MDDKDLIDLYWARSERAVAETMAQYGRRCHAVAYRILRSREDSEECVSDACLRVWEAIPPRRPENFPAFLIKLTRNAALHRYERQRAQKRGGGQVPLALEELRECAGGEERTAEDLTIREELEEDVRARQEDGFIYQVLSESESGADILVECEDPERKLLVHMVLLPYGETTGLWQVVSYEVVEG